VGWHPQREERHTHAAFLQSRQINHPIWQPMSNVDFLDQHSLRCIVVCVETKHIRLDPPCLVEILRRTCGRNENRNRCADQASLRLHLISCLPYPERLLTKIVSRFYAGNGWRNQAWLLKKSLRSAAEI